VKWVTPSPSVRRYEEAWPSTMGRPVVVKRKKLASRRLLDTIGQA
jgi:hypothetical protein